MSEYPEYLKPSICEGKRRYGDKGAAEARIDKMRSRQVISLTEEMNAYKCPFCTFFHVGHKRKSVT